MVRPEGLSYYTSPSDDKPLMSVPLYNAKLYPLVEKGGDVKPQCFNIRTDFRDFLCKVCIAIPIYRVMDEKSLGN